MNGGPQSPTSNHRLRVSHVMQVSPILILKHLHQTIRACFGVRVVIHIRNRLHRVDGNDARARDLSCSRRKSLIIKYEYK